MSKSDKKETKVPEKKEPKKELITANQYVTMKNIRPLHHRPGMLAYAKQQKGDPQKTIEQWEEIFKRY